MRTDSYNPPAERAVFAYLDDLRESGIINMFGAPGHVVREFGCSRQEASDFVSEWMNSCCAPYPKADR